MARLGSVIALACVGVRTENAQVARKSTVAVGASFSLPIAALDKERGGIALNHAEELFSLAPGFLFAVKDAELRYISANQALVQVFGAKGRGDIIGKTARAFYPDPIWRRWETLESESMRTAQPNLNRLDLIVPLKGEPLWASVSIWPVPDADQEIVGVASVARVVSGAESDDPALVRLSRVVRRVQEDPAARHDVPLLATTAQTSVSQLERDFRRILGVSPKAYVMRVRLERALDLLRSSLPIAQVADACGYPDQSAFTRNFRLSLRMSPRAYRRSLMGERG